MPKAPPPAFAEAPGSHGGPVAPEQSAQPDIVKATWKKAHPSAKKWADRRRTSMAGRIRRTPKPTRIMLGAVVVGLSAWLLVSELPGHKPLTSEEREVISKQAGVDEDIWRFSKTQYLGAQGAAGGLLFIGVLVAIRGAFFRPRVPVRCRRCGTDVVADKEGFHFRCPNGGHRAATSVSSFALLVLFLVNAALLGALYAMSALGIAV